MVRITREEDVKLTCKGIDISEDTIELTGCKIIVTEDILQQIDDDALFEELEDRHGSKKLRKKLDEFLLD